MANFVFHADDFGLSKSISNSILDAIDNGVIETYNNGQRDSEELKWNIVSKEVNVKYTDDDVGVFRINPDRSLTAIAQIKEGKRRDISRKVQLTNKKIEQLPVTMMRLGVQDHDVLHTHQVRHHSLDHLSIRFLGLNIIAGLSLEQRPATSGNRDPLFQSEGVVVGNDHSCFFYVWQELLGH